MRQAKEPVLRERVVGSSHSLKLGFRCREFSESQGPEGIKRARGLTAPALPVFRDALLPFPERPAVIPVLIDIVFGNDGNAVELR